MSRDSERSFSIERSIRSEPSSGLLAVEVMVSFQCHGCGDVVKKPKLDHHRSRCHSGFDCIDCHTTFNGPNEYSGHTQCITEAEKYQKSLYKGAKTKGPSAPQGYPRTSLQNGARARMSPVTVTPPTIPDEPELVEQTPTAEKKKKDKKRKGAAEAQESIARDDEPKKKKPRTPEAAVIPNPATIHSPPSEKKVLSPGEEEPRRKEGRDEESRRNGSEEGGTEKPKKKEKRKRAQTLEGGVIEEVPAGSKAIPEAAQPAHTPDGEEPAPKKEKRRKNKGVSHVAEAEEQGVLVGKEQDDEAGQSAKAKAKERRKHEKKMEREEAVEVEEAGRDVVPEQSADKETKKRTKKSKAHDDAGVPTLLAEGAGGDLTAGQLNVKKRRKDKKSATQEEAEVDRLGAEETRVTEKSVLKKEQKKKRLTVEEDVAPAEETANVAAGLIEGKKEKKRSRKLRGLDEQLAAVEGAQDPAAPAELAPEKRKRKKRDGLEVAEAGETVGRAIGEAGKVHGEREKRKDKDKILKTHEVTDTPAVRKKTTTHDVATDQVNGKNKKRKEVSTIDGQAEAGTVPVDDETVAKETEKDKKRKRKAADANGDVEVKSKKKRVEADQVDASKATTNVHSMEKKEKKKREKLHKDKHGALEAVNDS